MKQEQIEMRREKGREIAKTSRIIKTETGWKVPSQNGKGNYIVKVEGHGAVCSCPDFETRHCKCKHIWAVEMVVTHEVDNEGNVTITQTIRKTYPQNWKAYDQASTKQKIIFMNLLRDITDNAKETEYKFGRPTLPVKDLLYGSVMKVYTTFSLRRFMSDMEIAKEKGFISQKPCYASIGHFMQRKDITPALVDMVKITSLPLREIERDFSIDSTGFGTTNFQRWFSFKHGKEISSRRWVKCHFMNGIKSNIITGVKITTEFDNDSPQLKELVDATAENFDMEEISADKAYSSRDNHEIIASTNATPFIPFRKNATGKSDGSAVWKKMYHYFMLNNEEFLQHYHKRSNAETTVQMIKSKFGDMVRSKTWTAQVNEVLCKVICHNICCVIQEMHELGINPNFCVESQQSVYKVTEI